MCKKRGRIRKKNTKENQKKKKKKSNFTGNRTRFSRVGGESFTIEPRRNRRPQCFKLKSNSEVPVATP